MTTLTYSGTLTRTWCCVCAIPFAIPSNYLEARRRDGQTIHCPNGHQIGWFDDTDAKKRERAEAELERAQQRIKWLREDVKTTEQRLSAQRGQTTKARNEAKRLKERAANGVCPCCHRSFANLRRHMDGQHPGFAHETA